MRLHESILIATVTVVLLKVLLAGVTIGASFTVGGIDAASIVALLSPVMGSLHLRDYLKRGKDEVT